MSCPYQRIIWPPEKSLFGPSFGSQLPYTIRATNTGNVVLNGTVTDTLPAHVAPTGILSWPLTDLSPDNVWTKQVVLTVEMGYSGTMTNQVQVTTVEGATDIYTITSQALVTSVLAVTKDAAPNPVRAGLQLTYTLCITNTGNVDLHATITDTLPDHITSVGVITWTANLPAPGGVWTRTVIVTVTRGYSGTLTNRVQVTTLEGATGESQIAVRAIGYQVFLPIVVRQ